MNKAIFFMNMTLDLSTELILLVDVDGTSIYIKLFWNINTDFFLALQLSTEP